MKPTKRATNVTRVKKSTKVARKPRKVNVKRAYDSKSIVGKLLKLKYMLNDAHNKRGRIVPRDDKNYVMSLISDAREHKFNKLSYEDGLKCNELWKKYA